MIHLRAQYTCLIAGRSMKPIFGINLLRRILTFMCVVSLCSEKMELEMKSKFSITDAETAFKAVALNGMAFQFVLPELCTEALALIAVERNAHVLKCVPEQFRTETVLLKALESDVYVPPHIPEQAWSETLAIKVVEKHALDLKVVPLNFRTEAVVLKAVQGNGMALEHVPKQLFTQSLVDAAMAGCDKALQYAPLEYRTEEASLRAGISYKFKYQNLDSEEVPGIICIVPQAWLAKSLPVMGGAIAYVDTLDLNDTDAGCVFDFSEGISAGQTRTIVLDIHHRKWEMGTGRASSLSKLCDAPVKIHCRALEDNDVNKDWCVEVVLLNHFFGSHAYSATMGNIYLDFGDVFIVMQSSSEFKFEFGIGDNPEDIISGILERVMPGVWKSVFLVMFGRSGEVRIADLDTAVAAFDFDDTMRLISDVAVDQDKMLISVLLGC